VIKHALGSINLPLRTKKLLASLSWPAEKELPNRIFNLGQSYRGPKVSASTKAQLYNTGKEFA
jgi:hypothetical protein